MKENLIHCSKFYLVCLKLALLERAMQGTNQQVLTSCARCKIMTNNTFCTTIHTKFPRKMFQEQHYYDINSWLLCIKLVYWKYSKRTAQAAAQHGMAWHGTEKTFPSGILPKR